MVDKGFVFERKSLIERMKKGVLNLPKKVFVNQVRDWVDACISLGMDSVDPVEVTKVRDLKREIRMLEKLVDVAQPECWDLKEVYRNICDRTWYGNKIPGYKSDPEFAKWFAKRYDIFEEEK